MRSLFFKELLGVNDLWVCGVFPSFLFLVKKVLGEVKDYFVFNQELAVKDKVNVAVYKC